MARRIPIFDWGVLPQGSSGEVFFEPMGVKATNDLYDRLVLIYTDTATRIGAAGHFPVPQNYSAGAKIGIVWTVASSAGTTTVFDFDYTAIGGVESLDPSADQESVTFQDATPTTALGRLEVSATLTAANFAAGDNVSFELFRDGADSSDTLAADLIVWDAFFEYTT